MFKKIYYLQKNIFKKYNGNQIFEKLINMIEKNY